MRTQQGYQGERALNGQQVVPDGRTTSCFLSPRTGSAVSQHTSCTYDPTRAECSSSPRQHNNNFARTDKFSRDKTDGAMFVDRPRQLKRLLAGKRAGHAAAPATETWYTDRGFVGIVRAHAHGGRRKKHGNVYIATPASPHASPRKSALELDFGRARQSIKQKVKVKNSHKHAHTGPSVMPPPLGCTPRRLNVAPLLPQWTSSTLLASLELPVTGLELDRVRGGQCSCAAARGRALMRGDGEWRRAFGVGSCGCLRPAGRFLLLRAASAGLILYIRKCRHHAF